MFFYAHIKMSESKNFAVKIVMVYIDDALMDIWLKELAYIAITGWNKCEIRISP